MEKLPYKIRASDGHWNLKFQVSLMHYQLLSVFMPLPENSFANGQEQ